MHPKRPKGLGLGLRIWGLGLGILQILNKIIYKFLGMDLSINFEIRKKSKLILKSILKNKILQVQLKAKKYLSFQASSDECSLYLIIFFIQKKKNDNLTMSFYFSAFF
jgi:hypothetical protein